MNGSCYTAYLQGHFGGNPFSFFRAPSLKSANVSGSYQYLNCANGRLTPVNVTYDHELHILEACPPPSKVFRLNPDAKSFVPMRFLNPNAREFKPKNFLEENLRHKRAYSSTHSSEEDEVSSSDDSILPPPPVISQPTFTISTNTTQGQSSLDDTLTSSNSNGEVFVSSPPKNECSSERKEICDRLKICTLGSSDESDEDDSEVSHDEDDDWDDLEFGSPQSPSAWGDIPDEFKNNIGLTCPLSQSNPSSPSLNTTSRVKEFLLNGNPDDSEDSEDEEESSLEDLAREKELQERLAAINKEWSLHYPSSSNSNLLSVPNVDMKKNVSFSSENCWNVIEEDPELALELRESRTSDYLARKANLERIEVVISPILDSNHRDKVFKRLYSTPKTESL